MDSHSIAAPNAGPIDAGPVGNDPNTVTVPNPTEAISGNPPAPSTMNALPPEDLSDTGSPDATEPTDSSPPVNQEEVAPETELSTESQGNPPPEDFASPDDKGDASINPADGAGYPDQSQDVIDQQNKTGDEAPTSTDDTLDSGAPTPPADTGDPCIPAESGAPVKPLGLSSNSVPPKVASTAEVPGDDPATLKQPATNKSNAKVGKAGLGWNNESGKRWDQFINLPGSQVGW